MYFELLKKQYAKILPILILFLQTISQSQVPD
jgi:hypothetical protein